MWILIKLNIILFAHGMIFCPHCDMKRLLLEKGSPSVLIHQGK